KRSERTLARDRAENQLGRGHANAGNPIMRSSPENSAGANLGCLAPAPVPVCSIVIPTYNGRELLRLCLASIERNRPRDPELPIEVIVADDASSDGTSEWMAKAHPAVRLVRLERNAGFCAAANAGMAAARGTFIHLLNNDTGVEAGWVEAGLAPFADETVGSVAPLVLVRSEPERVDSAGDSYSWVGWPTKRGHGEPTVRWESRPHDE